MILPSVLLVHATPRGMPSHSAGPQLAEANIRLPLQGHPTAVSLFLLWAVALLSILHSGPVGSTLFLWLIFIHVSRKSWLVVLVWEWWQGDLEWASSEPTFWYWKEISLVWSWNQNCVIPAWSCSNTAILNWCKFHLRVRSDSAGSDICGVIDLGFQPVHSQTEVTAGQCRRWRDEEQRSRGGTVLLQALWCFIRFKCNHRWW